METKRRGFISGAIFIVEEKVAVYILHDSYEKGLKAPVARRSSLETCGALSAVTDRSNRALWQHPMEWSLTIRRRP